MLNCPSFFPLVVSGIKEPEEHLETSPTPLTIQKLAKPEVHETYIESEQPELIKQEPQVVTGKPSSSFVTNSC